MTSATPKTTTRQSQTVLIIHAHPEPQSLTNALAQRAKAKLETDGHRVLESDLYRMGWKAVADAADFPDRSNPDRLRLVAESGHAFKNGTQPDDVVDEQAKLLAADAVIFQFPLWWFGLPAIMKGWIERVFAYGLAYGYRDAGNTYRYGDGALRGKRALLSVTVGGPEADYGPRGINGALDDLLFPMTHGTLFFAGMAVLPSHAIYGVDRIDPSAWDTAFSAYEARLDGLFSDTPIPFRFQNSGDYADGHTLNDTLSAGHSGLGIHRHDAGAIEPTLAFPNSVQRAA